MKEHFSSNGIHYNYVDHVWIEGNHWVYRASGRHGFICWHNPLWLLGIPYPIFTFENNSYPMLFTS
jgi:hypothetical protein